MQGLRFCRVHSGFFLYTLYHDMLIVLGVVIRSEYFDCYRSIVYSYAFENYNPYTFQKVKSYLFSIK